MSDFYIYKSFWKNLGMKPDDVKKLPFDKYEALADIFNLENQHQERQMKKNGK